MVSNCALYVNCAGALAELGEARRCLCISIRPEGWSFGESVGVRKALYICRGRTSSVAVGDYTSFILYWVFQAASTIRVSSFLKKDALPGGVYIVGCCYIMEARTIGHIFPG